jgi:hypothetical protein
VARPSDTGVQALAASGLSLDSLKKAMRAEEAARLSMATQRAYAAAEARTDSSWLTVTADLQRRVLERAGVPSERMAAALYVLRAAAQLFPDDAELRAIPLQVRNNRACEGRLREGGQLVDLPLHHLNSGTTSLSKACAGRPTLLVAGSFT